MVVRYLIQKTPIGTMMKANAEGNWVASEDFDRILAERDALQSRLNSVEPAAREMLRIAGIANQGSNAYNRAIINLHQALERNS